MLNNTQPDQYWEHGGNILRCLDIPVLDQNKFKIYDYTSFKNAHLAKNWTLNQKYAQIDIYLQNIDRYLKNTYSNDIDPLQYLHYLYYSEGLSFNNIYDRTCHLHSYSDCDTIRKIFIDRFWWKSRDSNERTPISLKVRQSSLNTTWVQKYILDTRKETQNKFNAILKQEGVSQSQNTNFDEDTYLTYKFKYQKFLYIMNVLYDINESMSIKIIQKLIADSIWARSLAHIFQSKVDSVLEWTDHELSLSQNQFNYINNRN